MAKQVNEKIGCWRKMGDKAGAICWQTEMASYEIIISSLTSKPGKFGAMFLFYKSDRCKGKLIGSSKTIEGAVELAENWMREHSELSLVQKWAFNNLR